MGRDLRYIFFSKEQNIDDIPFSEYHHLYDVSRHNNNMISGCFTYNELRIKIKEFVELLEDEEDEEEDDEINEKDIFESINVISKILTEMDKKQLVNILYD